MANVSVWCLPTSVQKEWCVGFYYRNDKESHTFQWQKPPILQHDVDTYVLLTYVSSFSINRRSVSLYELVTKKSYVLSIETYS